SSDLLARDRCHRRGARAPRIARRDLAARQAQADLRPPHGHGRLRHHRQRRQGRRQRHQARQQVRLPAQRLPRRAEEAHGRRDAGEAPGPARREGGQGHAPEEPPRPGDGEEAQGLRRPRPPARRAEAGRVRDHPGRPVTYPDATTPEEGQPVTTPESEYEAVEEAAVDAEATEYADATDAYDTEIGADVALPEIPAVYSDRPIQTVGRRKEAVVRVRLVPGS